MCMVDTLETDKIFNSQYLEKVDSWKNSNIYIYIYIYIFS
jgi:hypothetical protein